MYRYIYIYIHIDRDGERERDMGAHTAHPRIENQHDEESQVKKCWDFLVSRKSHS